MKIKKSKSPFTIGLLVILLFYTVIMATMLFWALITSLKTPADFMYNMIGLPKEGWIFSNYGEVVRNFGVKLPAFEIPVGIWEQLLYTMITVTGGAFLAALAPCIMAYCCAIYRNKFSSIIYWVVIITMMLPIVGNYASEMRLVRAIGIYDNVFGNLIFKFNFLGMYFLVFHASFAGVGKDYFEAAQIDGANDFTICFRIIFPLVKTIFFTVFIIKFILFWNDYQTPLLYLPTHPTLAVGVYDMSQRAVGSFSSVPYKMVSCLLMMIPVLILFVAFRKMIMGNISMGGVKE
jgi:ABC-type glycerol-3-phosphate transport system permease component